MGNTRHVLASGIACGYLELKAAQAAMALVGYAPYRVTAWQKDLTHVKRYLTKTLVWDGGAKSQVYAINKFDGSESVTGDLWTVLTANFTVTSATTATQTVDGTAGTWTLSNLYTLADLDADLQYILDQKPSSIIGSNLRKEYSYDSAGAIVQDSSTDLTALGYWDYLAVALPVLQGGYQSWGSWVKSRIYAAMAGLLVRVVRSLHGTTVARDVASNQPLECGAAAYEYTTPDVDTFPDSSSPTLAACRVAATGPLTLAGLQTVDGVSLAAGDRVLVRFQADRTANGIYEAATGTWSRISGWTAVVSVTGSWLVVPVTAGDRFHDTTFVLSNSFSDVEAIFQGPCKAPCKAATTANITLSGLQTLSGYALLAGDRVAVVKQTTEADNGIYLAASGAWTRATDLDAAAEFAADVTYHPYGSTYNLGLRVENAALGWNYLLIVNSASGYIHNAGQNQVNWPYLVRVASTANLTLSGLQTVDGVSLAAGDRVLVRAQTDPTQNGVYDVASGSWSRSPDFDAGGDFSGKTVAASEGAVFGGVPWAAWKIATAATGEESWTAIGTVTLGTTGIHWFPDGTEGTRAWEVRHLRDREIAPS